MTRHLQLGDVIPYEPPAPIFGAPATWGRSA